MLDLLTRPDAWAAFLTLCAMEMVLGVDNVVFISLLVGKLPEPQATRARRAGLSLALVFRVALLSLIAYFIGLTAPLFTLPFDLPEIDGKPLVDPDVSLRDLILIAGGLFLIYKATHEIHGSLEGEEEGGQSPAGRAAASFVATVLQIGIIDIVFSLDSVITAVGMAQHLIVMIAAVVIAIIVMLVASGPLSDFISRHPTVKMLALAFLLLIGMALIADGVGFHIPKGYIYAAMAFSVLVEMLNLAARRKRNPVKLRKRL
jgi:predicted tellurium resistance membrane protein TerC